MTSQRYVTDYRSRMASLLLELVDAVDETERWLNGTVDDIDASTQAAFEDDPARIHRIVCGLFLRKARLHMVAVLRAHETGNLQSLGVQMRPVLASAGQVVLILHSLMSQLGRGESAEQIRIEADFYRAAISPTNDNPSHLQLLHLISKAAGISPVASRGAWFTHLDRVAPLDVGREWYGFLSEFFCHGASDWEGQSWQGRIRSIGTVQDGLMFAGLMDYLVEQGAVMNAYATLCPVAGEVAHQQAVSALAQLRKVRAASSAVRDSARQALEDPGAGFNE